MDQIKIGNFLKELRKEKNLTQEQEADIFNVSRRTVTRWETGYNMPDLSVLVEIADYYNVDLREIFNGERKEEKMNKELEDTVKQVAEYTNIEKTREAKVVMVYAIIGIISLIANQVLLFLDLEDTFWIGFAKGGTGGLTMASLILALLLATGKLTKIKEAKRRLLSK